MTTLALVVAFGWYLGRTPRRGRREDPTTPEDFHMAILDVLAAALGLALLAAPGPGLAGVVAGLAFVYGRPADWTSLRALRRLARGRSR